MSEYKENINFDFATKTLEKRWSLGHLLERLNQSVYVKGRIDSTSVYLTRYPHHVIPYPNLKKIRTSRI